MTYTEKRDEFIYDMAQEGLSLDACKQVLKLAQQLQNIALAYCQREITKREENTKERNRDKINKLIEPFGIKAEFQGDPRGYVVKLMLKSGKSNSFSGQGYGVPVK